MQSKSKPWSIERVVTLLTPLFAAGSAWVVGIVGTNVPGAPKVDPTAITSLEIAGFVGAVGIVAKWLHGRQIPAIRDGVTTVEQLLAPLVADLNKVGLTPEVEAIIRAEVQKALAGVHVPAVEEVVNNVLSAIGTVARTPPPPPAAAPPTPAA